MQYFACMPFHLPKIVANISKDVDFSHQFIVGMNSCAGCPIMLVVVGNWRLLLVLARPGHHLPLGYTLILDTHHHVHD